MITYEQLESANERINKVPIKGKDYAMVNERVKAFREICPAGAIETAVLYYESGVVTIQATVKDEEGRVLGQGIAQEKETSSFINKTSYFENCETSAVGRALGFAGIGIDGSMASAEEVANAITQQTDLQKITDKEAKRLVQICIKKGKKPEEIFNVPVDELTVAQYQKAVATLSKMKDVV